MMISIIINHNMIINPDLKKETMKNREAKKKNLSMIIKIIKIGTEIINLINIHLSVIEKVDQMIIKKSIKESIVIIKIQTGIIIVRIIKIMEILLILENIR